MKKLPNMYLAMVAVLCVVAACDATERPKMNSEREDVARLEEEDASTPLDADIQGDQSLCATIQCEESESPCERAVCNPTSGQCELSLVEEGTPCDDQNECTLTDVCSGGVCVGEGARVCDDGDVCNGVETCDAALGCRDGSPLTCDDGDACNGAETCDEELGCQDGTPLTCDDGDICNGVETCDEALGCQEGTPLTCDDGDACNGVETCDGVVGCQAGVPLTCDDGDACNGAETCDEALGCQAGVPLTCDDGDVCNGVETCDEALGCQSGVPLTCDDGDACNGAETCDEALGCQAGVPLTCDDGDACNGVETCDETLGCQGSEPVSCLNGGECVSEGQQARCECPEGTSGDLCENTCGDGVRSEYEECDDGNEEGDDGCDECRVGWGYYCHEEQGASACLSVCGDGLKAREEGCDDGNEEDDDGCSSTCSVETPVTFNCAIANHEAQLDIAPDYWYAQAHNGIADTEERQPLRRTWEPILEEVPGCNGLEWSSSAVDRPLKEFQFLVVLDASWVSYYAENQAHFTRQGYPTIESSYAILLDRVSYLYEAQFGVRVSASQVVVLPNLLEKCATNGLYTEDNIEDETNTPLALRNAGVTIPENVAGLLRLGVGAVDTYCHSYAPFNGICSQAVFVNQQKPFDEGSGRLNHRAALVLAHEFGHYLGICSDGEHPHCLNGHLTNEIPDIMVWDGTPASNVRDMGMFYKFFTSCSPVYDILMCENIKGARGACGVPLTCQNGGLDCETVYWSALGSGAPDSTGTQEPEIRPRGARLPVRCCEDAEDGAVCHSTGLGGLVGPQECSGLMTWPEASRYCSQAGYRLCTLSELDTERLCAGTGCEYDQERVWTGSPVELSEADLTGTYHRLPVTNPWHEVTVSESEGGLLWSNSADVSWSLTWAKGALSTGPDCPYGALDLSIHFERDQGGVFDPSVKGLIFNDELYVKQ